MKKIASVLIAVLFASMLVFTACSGSSGTVTGEIPPVSEIWTKVKEASGFGEMTLVPTRDYLDIYGIDSKKLAESVWYMSENSATNADEVVIMKAADSSYVDTLSKLLKERVDSQINVCKKYSPEQAAKLEKTEVVTAGDYVYFCVGDNYDAMMSVFRSIFK